MQSGPLLMETPTVDGVQFPVLGNSIILALVILTHVFFAFFAVGGLALSVTAGMVGDAETGCGIICGWRGAFRVSFPT